MSKEKVIYIACPWSLMGGGMYRVSEYLMQCQKTDEVPPPQRAKLRALETRGRGRAAASVFVLGRALYTLGINRLLGRVVGVHVNIAERLSLFRKGAIVLFARMIGLPVVLHLHAAQLTQSYMGLPKVAQALVRSVFKAATRCIVLGEGAKQFAIETLKVSPDRVEIVINGVPEPSYPRSQASSSGGSMRMLFLGNLGERKGVSDLLQALANSKLAKEGRIEAIFAGGGDVSHYQAKAHSLGVDHFTKFVGWASQDQSAKWMASADVLVLPSYDEGLPLVILEAFANSVAVICTPVGEIQNFITGGRDALFVLPGDVGALTAALDNVLGNKDVRGDLEMNGRKLYMGEFSALHFSEKIAAIHLDCFGHASRPLGKGV